MWPLVEQAFVGSGSNTSSLKMIMWEAVPEQAIYIISIIKNRSHQAVL